MSTIECPICNNEVMGEGPDVLSENLRKHFIDVHKNRVVEEVAHLRPVREGEPSKEVEEVGHLRPVREGEPSKEVEEVAHLEPVREGPPSKEVEEVSHLRPVREGEPSKEVEEVSHFKPVREGEPSKEVEEVAHLKPMPGPARPSSMAGGEMGKPMVSCPVCGKTIQGESDEDLSKQLREHVNGAHKL